MSAHRLDGKVAFITGSGGGMGRAEATLMAERGADIIVHDVKAEGANKTAELVRATGRKAHVIIADVTDIKTMTAEIAKADKAMGKIDILVNNAGLLNAVPLAEMSVEIWDEMIQTHLRGMFLCTRFVIPHMLKQKYGKVINMSGTFGVLGGENFSHLSAAKAGMIGFTQALAKEVGKDGINVNAIAPAIIRTDLYNFMPEEVRDSIVGTYPLRRVGEVEDVVSTAMFLATKDSAFFTGQTLCPAGGDVMV